MKLLPMIDFLGFFALSFAEGKNDGWILVCRISFRQWWSPHDKNSNTNNYARNFWQYLSNRNQLKFDYSYLILSKKSVGWILLLTN